MAYNTEAYNKRNKLIYEYYCSRWGDGVRDELIYCELSERYHLQTKTLEDIVRMVRKESMGAQTEINFKDEAE
jgi:hypothetical protein